jgi:hypothetical protein
VWACPVCAAKVTERRRVELEKAIGGWESDGGKVMLVTLTFPHRRSDELSDLFAKLRKALQRLWKGKLAARDAESWGYVGQVRALEVTHGQNGWHPHVHVLMFFEPGSDVYLPDVSVRLRSRWLTAAAAAGLIDLGDEKQLADFGTRGLDVRDGMKAAGYVTKMGLEEIRRHGLACEVTKAPSKRGRTKTSRTPFSMLWDFLEGDTESARLFAEYAAASKGQRQLVWSRGLRAQLDLGEDKTDEEVAAEVGEVDDPDWMKVEARAWWYVDKRNVRAQLLNVADKGDRELVWSFIASLGWRRRDEKGG